MTPDKEFNWIVAFTFIDSLNRIFYGMYSTFLGPSQPYLARKVGVDIDTIAWIQPFGKYSNSILCPCIRLPKSMIYRIKTSLKIKVNRISFEKCE